jgi:CheY-like chemotaxis protein
MVSSEQFLELVRNALKHLYDPYLLRRSPLIGFFGLQDQPDAIPALQHILTSAIEGLEPKIGSVNASQRQLIYDLLMYRYVQQFSQEEVANHLGMSVRHLRREQNDATYVLAAELWKQYKSSDRVFEPARTDLEMEAEPEAAKIGIDEPAGNDELAFLRATGSGEPVQINRVLPDALQLARPLAQKYGVRLQLAPLDDLPDILAKPMALRQLLLTIFGIAIYRATGQEVSVTARIVHGMVDIQVVCSPANVNPLPENQTEKENLEMAYSLAEICGSKLKFSTEAGAFQATFTLPTNYQYKVFVVDDNLDNYHLMEHFSTGTRYKLSGTQDPTQALKLVEQEAPDLIILDVMMPQIDGWEILGRLRNHPQTHHIPIIVCTILSQQEMALTLGASGFIHKPISRQNLLA